MAMAAGLIKGYAAPADRQAKIDHYALVQAMAAEFRAEFGTILCRELLKDIATTAGGEPEPRTPEYYEKRRRCGLCIARAAAIAQKYLLAPDGKDA